MGLRSFVSGVRMRRRFSRRWLTLCSGAVALVALVVSLASLALASTTGFPDAPSSHPYYSAITGLANRGIIGGYADGTFGAGDAVTRRQFAKMVVKTGGYTVTGSEACPFTDVEAQTGTDPFYPSKYVAVCAGHGITTGKNATTFDLTGKITRYQVVTMVVRMADDLQPALLATPPADWSGNATWAGNPIHGANAARAECGGLLSGLDLVSLDPNGAMSRGEVAQVLYNALGKLAAATTTTVAQTTTTTMPVHETQFTTIRTYSAENCPSEFLDPLLGLMTRPLKSIRYMEIRDPASDKCLRLYLAMDTPPPSHGQTPRESSRYIAVDAGSQVARGKMYMVWKGRFSLEDFTPQYSFLEMGLRSTGDSMAILQFRLGGPFVPLPGESLGAYGQRTISLNMFCSGWDGDGDDMPNDEFRDSMPGWTEYLTVINAGGEQFVLRMSDPAQKEAILHIIENL